MNLVVCEVHGGPRKAPEKGLQCAQLRHWRQGKKNKNNNNIIKRRKPVIQTFWKLRITPLDFVTLEGE